ncbi:MAG TPA: glucose 1-dehydrogenase [Rariglobus sp.]
MTTQKLAGKTALVTGASKGIGASIAKHLAAAGATVAVNYASSKAGADKVVAQILAAGGKAFAVAGDVSKPEDITHLLAETKSAFGGRLDILVNNAGVYEFAPLEAVTPELFHREFNINVLGLLLVTQAALPLFPATGGSVINISSLAAKNALPNTSVYSATKAAVDSITRVLSVELGAKKIRVNSINPGMVETEGVHTAGFAESDFRKKIEAETPLGRIGQPQDIGPAAVFLASDDSAWLSGESIVIAGGSR